MKPIGVYYRPYCIVYLLIRNSIDYNLDDPGLNEYDRVV
jgi:hypothetical protein